MRWVSENFPAPRYFLPGVRGHHERLIVLSAVDKVSAADMGISILEQRVEAPVSGFSGNSPAGYAGFQTVSLGKGSLTPEDQDCPEPQFGRGASGIRRRRLLYSFPRTV